MRLFFYALLAVLWVNATAQLSFECPSVLADSITFDLAGDSSVTLKRTETGSLCLLTLPGSSHVFAQPVARSYNGRQWERAGGMLGSRLNPWNCDADVCESVLKAGTGYRLQTRTTATISRQARVARFLESASFGAMPNQLKDWNYASFADYVKEQVDLPPTYHREYYRSRLIPSWRFHKAEYAASLDPCVAQTYWRRNMFNVKDRRKIVTVRQLDGRWEISVDGHVRGTVKQFRSTDPRSEVEDGGVYELCSSNAELHRGIYKIRIGSRCRAVEAEDTLVDFSDGFVPRRFLAERLPSLTNQNQWNLVADNLYVKLRATDRGTCAGLVGSGLVDDAPIFALTRDGVWLVHDPRVILDANTAEQPLMDGGYNSFLNNRTKHCSNVAMNQFNEATCKMSSSAACRPGGVEAIPGAVVCGSEGEVSNEKSMFSYLDITSIPTARARLVGLPADTSMGGDLSRQREFIWTDIALTAEDQLRQRVAWALFQIFALPKSSIRMETRVTESFLSYYDIFIRHAFGNYGDILREISLNPLMAESLSFVGSRSVGAAFSRGGRISLPDENFARELMQLFTISLIQINRDGTPVLDGQNKTASSYSMENIVAFSRAWTGFQNQRKRSNIEGLPNLNRIDPLAVNPMLRDRFPKSDLFGGYIGDGFPLCSRLPSNKLFRKGAKYRLLGTYPVPQDTDGLPFSEKTLQIIPGSSLFSLLCSPGPNEDCSYPGSVVVDDDIECEGMECSVNSVRVVQVNSVFYEYIPDVPCVTYPFYNNGIMVGGESRRKPAFCANLESDYAGVACCMRDARPNFQVAMTTCRYTSERTSFVNAEETCAATEMELCNYKSLLDSDGCPLSGLYWTNSPCSVKAKVNANGEAAVVHDAPNSNMNALVRENSPNFFKVNWTDGVFPQALNDCSGASCVVVDESCLCEVEVEEQQVFSNPPNERQAMNHLTVSHHVLDASYIESTAPNGMKYFSKDGSCCDSDTFFEVMNREGERKLMQNVVSTVKVKDSPFSFRNPPMFNKLVDFTRSDALHETEALLRHLLFHPNTAPYVATRMIERFGISNPSPEFVRRVATAFIDGQYVNSGQTFGTGKYGDLAATFSAVLLDPEMRNVLLDSDPYHGSLKEPILKVLAFMRAMGFSSVAPLTELDLMDQRVGQAPYEQPSVFSFFSPDFSPQGAASSSGLSAPEAGVMSSGRVINIVNGLFAMVDDGLDGCGSGFGFGCGEGSSGFLKFNASDQVDLKATISSLSDILTAGRLGQDKQDIIATAAGQDSDVSDAWRTAAKLLITAPEFHSTNRADVNDRRSSVSTRTTNEGKGTSYKAVIHFALRGGCDSFNVLVPHPSCGALHQEYKDIRGLVALQDDQILPLETLNQQCSTFGLHESLSFLKTLYDDGDLAFLANTGVLSAPVDSTNFRSETLTQLFAHNSMQKEVDVLDPRQDAMLGTGALGRLADVLNEAGFLTGRTAIEAAGTNLAGDFENPSPVYTLDQGGVKILDVDLSSPLTVDVIESLNGGLNSTQSGIHGEVWTSLLLQSLNQTERIYYILQQTAPTTTDFESSQLGQRFRLASQLISSREERRVERDFFFIDFAGWDMHSEVVMSLATRLSLVNDAVEDLVSELKALGVWDDVVIVQTSEFARTLSPNSGLGSDHGWGGNYWLAGGAVKGGNVVGKYPSTLQDGSDLDAGGRGRLIPTTPWESPFNAIAEWMGAESDGQLSRVLPNRNQFAELFAANDLFEDA